MPPAKKKPSPAFRVGDMVWASPDWDQGVKEPASVLELNCQYLDNGRECDDGILVKFHVSVKRSILPPSALTAYRQEEEDDAAPSGATNGRRSARLSSVSPRPSAKTEASRARALVTPSPTVHENDEEDDSDDGPIAVVVEEEEEVSPIVKKRGRSAKKAADEESGENFVQQEETKPTPQRRGRSVAAEKKAPVKKTDENSDEDEEEEKEEPAPKRRGQSSPKKASPKKVAEVEGNAIVKEIDQDEEEEKEEPAPKRRGRSSPKKASPKKVADTEGKPPVKETDENSDADVEEEKEEPAPKRRGRSSPKKASPKKVADADDEDMEPEETKKRDRSRSSVTPTKTPVKKKKTMKKSDEDADSDEGGSKEEAESPYFKQNKKAKTCTPIKAAVAEKPAAKKPAAKKSEAAKKPAPAKNKPSKKEKSAKAEEEDKEAAYSSGAEDDAEDNDEDDKPFQVEYSSSGRATCRRCDEVIPKGVMRISHVPLFRGKPGFRVYRHIECMVFSEDVHRVQDIGGWKKIKRTSREDFESLVLRVEESKIELQKEKEELEPDELVPVTFQGEMRKSPPGLTASLLPFQVEGASWMYHQETQLPDLHGGILADEMGMGKTLQTITTILDNRAMLQHSKPGAKHPPSLDGEALAARKRESDLWDKSVAEWEHEMEMNSIPKKIWPKKQHLTARAGTLVICPIIALTQWKAELEKFTAPGTFTIATYHGPNRAKEYPIDNLIKYDIVLTTYQALEADFRKMVSPNKVTCPNCGGKFKIDKLRVHLTYFCGEGATRTEAQARQQRTADRRNGEDGGGSGGRGGGKGSQKKKKSFSDEKKPPMTATKALQKPTATKKKAPVKKKSAKKVERNDSDEDSFVEQVVTTPTGRPSRSAAMTASRLLSSSMKEWTDGVGEEESLASDGKVSDSDEDDDESAVSYDDEDSDGEAIPSQKRPKKNVAPKTAARKKASPKKGKDSDSDSSDEEDDNPALARARKRQQAALDQAKKGTGKKSFEDKGKKSFKARGKKSFKGKDKGKGKAKGKSKKKKFDDDDSSSEDSDDSAGSKRDPLAGINLDKLMKEAMDGSRMSLLHSVCWWRVVLDEAHMIKSRSSQTAAAAFALIGINRWALSGTPLQNRVGELYSLIRFIRIDPMAHYFCRSKGCGCKSIHYRIKNGTCQDCGHRAFQHFSHFNKHVLNPIQRDGYSGDGRRAMFMLKNEVLDKCLLRRTKETRAEDMNLPPRIVTIRTINLHPVEKDFYDALYTQTKSSFSDYVAQGTLLNNYAHIFDLLTRMRQAVDHPYLIVYSKRNCDAAAAASSGPLIANGSADCDICHEPPTGRVVSSCCGAAYCRSCVIEYMTPSLEGAEERGTPCPSCRAPFSIDLTQASADEEGEDTLVESSPKNRSSKFKDNANGELGPSLSELKHVTTGSILRRINLAEFATSTKIEALVQELTEMRKKRPGSKALVFSQFVNMLDLIRWRLHADPGLAEMGLGSRILHGAMDRKSRDAALDDFREDGTVRVLLMSLKAGGVALNLTVASEVFLVDNWWNPAAEMQAIDRTHRLGQHRCIRAVRFIAEGTVEERVLQLQEKKRLVFDGTVGRDAGSLKMLTVDDMHSLFQ